MTENHQPAGQEEHLSKKEKEEAKPLYEYPIFLSENQIRAIEKMKLVRLYRNGNYIDIGKKGWKPPMKKKEIRAEIKRLEAMLGKQKA